ncbi:MAG: hypothetical protein AB7Y46_07340 [Armatimonadota bacterium]
MQADREFALRYLGDCLYGAILGQAGAARPANLVRTLPHGVRIGVALIRRVLEDDPRFVEVAGRFDLADRETLRHRPFGGAVHALLSAYGRPMPMDLMVSALARLRGGAPDYFRKLLEDYLSSRDDVRCVDEHVLSDEWFLVLEGEDEEAVLFYNELEADEELRELWRQCQQMDLRKRDPALTAAHILETFARPLRPKPLAFLTWVHHPQIFEPVEFVREVLRRDDIVAAVGHWMSRGQLQALHEELHTRSDALSGEGEETPQVSVAAVLAAGRPTTPHKLSEEDRANILAVLRAAQVPVGVDELVIDPLEIRPDQRKFTAALHAVNDMLEAEPDLLRVSPGRFMSRAAIPDWVDEVPEPLRPARTGDEEDILLELEALPGDLLDAVLDPVYEDICCDVEVELPPDLATADRTEYPLLHHHYVMGTMFVRAMDQTLFAGDAPIALLLMRHGEADVYPAWLNRKLRLLFGLARWYRRFLPPSGGVFAISRTEDPDAYLLEYDGRTAPELSPSEQRMGELERKRERVSHRPISTRDLMVELLAEHAQGLSFNALWAEMNAVRRTSRWQIASLLAFYPCFSQDGGRWRVDVKRTREPGPAELQEYVTRRPLRIENHPPSAGVQVQ